jgi:hypothetical protein
MKNLLNEMDVEDCYKTTRFFPKEESLSQIINTLKIFSDLKVSPDLLSFDELGFIILKENGLLCKVPIIDILNFAKKLIALKECKGFGEKEFLNGLNNPTQFRATMFEIDCAHFVFTNFNRAELELSPRVRINEKNKQPDFRFLTKNGLELFCECKSIASDNRINRSQIKKLIDHLDPHLKDVLDDTFRVEIALKVLPPYWDRNFSEQLSAIIQQLIKSKFIKIYINLTRDKQEVAYIKLCYREEKPYFNCLLNIGNKPPLEKPTLIVGEYLALHYPIDNTIKDALTQLSPNKKSAIFIFSLSENHAREAIQSFFKNNDVPNLCGIFSWTTNLNYYQNPKSTCNIHDLLKLELKNITISKHRKEKAKEEI